MLYRWLPVPRSRLDGISWSVYPCSFRLDKRHIDAVWADNTVVTPTLGSFFARPRQLSVLSKVPLSMAVTLHSTVLCTVGSCEGTWITSMWVSTLTDCLDNPAHHPNTTRLYVISTCHLIGSNAMSLPHIHIIANHSPPIPRLWPNNEVPSTLQSLEGILFKRRYISTEFLYLAPGFVLWD